jgi:hypothetical protein
MAPGLAARGADASGARSEKFTAKPRLIRRMSAPSDAISAPATIASVKAKPIRRLSVAAGSGRARVGSDGRITDSGRTRLFR